MSIKLSTLPYDQDALEPYVSARTLSYHYDKHHRGYVEKLNKLIKDTPYEALSLEDIVARARENADIEILNNAAQAWNHAFLWESMAPTGVAKPNGEIKRMIERDFGDLASFKARFKAAALSVFGSGWTWLVQDGLKLRIITSGNADSPVATHMTPLLTLDVWEHAYYLDYQNDRAGYIDAFLDKLINWDFAAANLSGIPRKKAA
jgi:Fe-Mn family superoxide dismutase